MLCSNCGNPVVGAFCSHCGAIAPTPPPPAALESRPPSPVLYSTRVRRHLQTLGILWYVYGVYRAATGLFAVLVLFGFFSPDLVGGWGPVHFEPHAPWMSAIASLVMVYTLVTAGLAFVVGWSLMARRPYGRILAIVMAAFALLKLPIGTALGLFTLWVLVPPASAAEYQSLAPPTPATLY